MRGILGRVTSFPPHSTSNEPRHPAGLTDNFGQKFPGRSVPFYGWVEFV